MPTIDRMLAGQGIHQIAELTAAEWRYVKSRVRKGSAVAVADYSFPRVTKRYVAV